MSLKTAPVLASSPKQMLEPLTHWPVKATNLEHHPCPIVSRGLLGGCLSNCISSSCSDCKRGQDQVTRHTPPRLACNHSRSTDPVSAPVTSYYKLLSQPFFFPVTFSTICQHLAISEALMRLLLVPPHPGLGLPASSSPRFAKYQSGQQNRPCIYPKNFQLPHDVQEDVVSLFFFFPKKEI